MKIFLIMDKVRKQKVLDTFFNEERPFLGIGDFYTRNDIDHYSTDRIINVGNAYDVVFFYKNTGTINILKKKKS